MKVRTNTSATRVSAAPQARSYGPANGWLALRKICADSAVLVPEQARVGLVDDADREQQRRGLAGGPGDRQHARR